MEGMEENVKNSANQERQEWLSEYEQTRKDLEASFTRDKYNVIRKELFAHRNDAALTFRPDNIIFNQSCINGLEGVVYVLISVNDELHRILVEPCDENTPHALRWCVANGSKRKSRNMKCDDFAGLVYKMMSWNANTRYKVLGFRIEIENGAFAYLFKLEMPERFDILPSRSKKKRAGEKLTTGETLTPDDTAGGKQVEADTPQKRAKGYYSEDLLSFYGIPYEQYQKDTSVTQKDGYIQMGMLTGGMEDIQEAKHGDA